MIVLGKSEDSQAHGGAEGVVSAMSPAGVSACAGDSLPFVAQNPAAGIARDTTSSVSATRQALDPAAVRLPRVTGVSVTGPHPETVTAMRRAECPPAVSEWDLPTALAAVRMEAARHDVDFSACPLATYANGRERLRSVRRRLWREAAKEAR